MTRPFVTLDVFTDRRFAGNPLAVVTDASGLDPAAMQAIAREFNLSETVFVLPPESPAARARLRIFTPGRELPFAGHPTVGTAVLLSRTDAGGARTFTLEENVGPISCRARPTGDDRGEAAFDLPRLPERIADLASPDALAAAVGIDPADIGCDALRPGLWSAGTPFALVPVRRLEAVSAAGVDLARFDEVFGRGGPGAVLLFCRETAEAGHAFHARMFAPEFGILEDPATGSAVAALAGLLAASGGYADGEHRLRIEQGYEMGRPSLIDLTILLHDRRLKGASIAGSAVVVSEGTIGL